MLKKFIGRGFLFILFLMSIGLIFTPTIKADDPNSTFSKEMYLQDDSAGCLIVNEIRINNGKGFTETIEGLNLKTDFATIFMHVQKGDWVFNTDTNMWDFRNPLEISAPSMYVNMLEEDRWELDLGGSPAGYKITYYFTVPCPPPPEVTTITNGLETTLVIPLENNCCGDYGRLAIEKTVTGELGDKNKEFNFVVNFSEDNENGYPYLRGDVYEGRIKNGDTIAIKDGERITIIGIPIDTTYEITEEEANEEGYTTTANGAIGTIVSGLTISSFENNKEDEEEKKEYGDLVIKKAVTGALGDKAKEFTFIVEFDDDGTYNYIGSKEGMISSGDKLTLKDGEEIRIEGLPVGTTYKVIEEEASSDGYKTIITGDEGLIILGTATASFENNKEDEIEEEEYGDLVIKKTVTGALGDKNKEFTFVVEFDNDGTYSYSGSKQGTITSGDKLTLKDGEEVRVEGLAVGTTYKVIEEEADKDGYKTTATDSEGIISEEESIVIYENNKEKAKTAAKELPKTGGMLMIALGGLSLFSGVTIIKSTNKKK